MFPKHIFVFALCSVVFCESAFVDTLSKCSKDDGDCHAKSLQNILKAAASGIPEYGIPPIDPAEVKNIHVSILDVIDITLNGVVKGAKNCVINKFTLNVGHGNAKLDITCDIVVKGKYKLFSSSPAIKSLLGGESVHGDGDGKIKIVKLNVKLVIPFEIVKRGDDIFLIGKKGEITFSFDILGKVTFAANNLYVGEKESSAEIIQIMNQESTLLVKSFGKIIFEKALDFMYDFVSNFFNKVPTKHYIIEDLTPFVTKHE